MQKQRNFTISHNLLFFRFSHSRRLDKLSKERIIRALKGLGLTEVDAQVYVFLAKEGPHKLREIAVALDLPERKVDRSLRELQSISIVKASIQVPLKFIAVPFEEVIDLFIEVKKEQAKTMQESREELLSSWKAAIKKETAKS
jgi:sugar-specific transcriptional regulator TrmB